MKRTPFKRKPRKWRIKQSEKAYPIKPRLWSLRRADDEFSILIRTRDGKCLFPGCDVTDIKKLQCSHYHGRTHKGTRYDPLNCIALCWRHHFKDKMLGYEYQKQTKEEHGFDGQYTIFMRKWLGETGFAELRARARSKYPQSQAIIDCMRLVNKI